MDNFNIEINDQLKKTKSFFSGPKIIFVILGVIILAEVIYAVRVLTAPLPTPTLVRQVSDQKIGEKIYLIVPKTLYKVGEVIPVSVIIDSRLHAISGADLVLNFDPKIIETTIDPIRKGNIFDEYPILSLDKGKGAISVSGVSNSKGGIKSQGQLAMLFLKAKAPGKTSLTIAFTKGSTVDSNLAAADTSEDILESVGNLELIIQ